MSPETLYRYDEPIGLYGFESLRRMAQATIREIVRYEDAREVGVPRELSDVLYDPMRTGEFRLSTLVSADDPTGHALVMTPYEPSDSKEVGITYYQIHLDTAPTVTEPKQFFTPLPHDPSDKKKVEEKLKELMIGFDKSEMEAIMRMAGKLTKSLVIAQELSVLQEDLDTQTRHLRALSDSLPKGARLQQLSSLEPNVFMALQIHKLDALKEHFPTSTHPSQQAQTLEQGDSAHENMHILEWKEFLDFAQAQFRRESDSDPKASIILQYMADTNHYFIKLEAQHGSLSQIKVLCYDDDGTMHKKKFDLRPETDDDDIDRLRIGPFWNRQELLACLREGQPISQEMYQSYLELADPDASRPSADVTDIRSRKKAT